MGSARDRVGKQAGSAEEPTSKRGPSALDGLLRSRPARWMIWEEAPLAGTASRLAALGVESLVYHTSANVPKERDLLSVTFADLAVLEGALGGDSGGASRQPSPRIMQAHPRVLSESQAAAGRTRHSGSRQLGRSVRTVGRLMAVRIDELAWRRPAWS